MYTLLDEYNQSIAVVKTEPKAGNFIRGAYPLGQYWDGGRMVPSPTKPRVPISVTPRQARTALALQPSPDPAYPHLLAYLEVVFNSMEEPQKTVAQIAWEYATSIERNSDLILQFQQSLGMTDTTVDQLFIQAGSL